MLFSFSIERILSGKNLYLLPSGFGLFFPSKPSIFYPLLYFHRTIFLYNTHSMTMVIAVVSTINNFQINRICLMFFHIPPPLFNSLFIVALISILILPQIFQAFACAAWVEITFILCVLMNLVQRLLLLEFMNLCNCLHIWTWDSNKMDFLAFYAEFVNVNVFGRFNIEASVLCIF